MATVRWAARMAGQLQHHQELDTTPPSPHRRRIQEIILCLTSVLDMDEAQEMQDEIKGLSEIQQLTRLASWQSYAEQVYG
jgi:flagellin-specific chaperone FliS